MKNVVASLKKSKRQQTGGRKRRRRKTRRRHKTKRRRRRGGLPGGAGGASKSNRPKSPEGRSKLSLNVQKIRRQQQRKSANNMNKLLVSAGGETKQHQQSRRRRKRRRNITNKKNEPNYSRAQNQNKLAQKLKDVTQSSIHRGRAPAPSREGQVLVNPSTNNNLTNIYNNKRWATVSQKNHNEMAKRHRNASVRWRKKAGLPSARFQTIKGFLPKNTNITYNRNKNTATNTGISLQL